MTYNKKTVLFLCTHNSCRSQMAEGLLRNLCSDKYESFSAGIEKTKIEPLAIKVMAEIGIDISDQYSKIIEEYKDKEFDYVVTVCNHAKEACLFFPGKKLIHKNFPDPSQTQGSEQDQLQSYRQVRDEIKNWVQSTFCRND